MSVGGGGFAFTPAQHGDPGQTLTAPVKPPVSDAEALLTFDEFMGALKQLEDDPTASQFAKEFRKDPALAALVKRFQDPAKRRAPGSLREFMQELSDRPEFRHLVAKFRAAPGSASLIAKLSELPGFTDLIRGVLGQKASAVASARAGAASPRAAIAGFSRAQGQAAARQSIATGFASGAGAGAGAQPYAAAAGPGAFGAGVPATGGMPGGTPPGNKPGGEAENVIPLGTLDEAGPGVTSDNFMSICIKQAGISKAECSAINDRLGAYGIWEACWLADLYDKCVAMCATTPELQCSGNAPGWTQACIKADENAPNRAASCGAMCRARGRTDCPAAPSGSATSSSSPTTYTIRPGDNLTAIVQRVYGITDSRTAYLTALELYDYGENRSATGNNPYNPNLIFPGRVLVLPPLPELRNMTITTFN